MKKTLKTVCVISVFLIIAAIVLFVITIITDFSGDSGLWGKFGADYYTYVVQNLKDIAYNTSYGTLKLMKLGKIVSCALECMMLCLGVVGMVFSLEKLNKIKKEEINLIETSSEIK